MTDTNVIPLRPRQDAPVQPLPRSIFGLRRAHVEAGLEAAKADDVRASERIRRLAAEARNALDGKHVCPSLKAELSAEVGVIAEMCERAAAKAKAIGNLRAAVQLREHQGLLETLSAEVSPDLPEGA